MNKLSKDKRDRLILTCIGALGAVAVLYFLVITDQKAEIMETDLRLTAMRSKRDTAQRLIKRASQIEADLAAARADLAKREADMPRPNDDHVWFLKIMADRRNRFEGRLDIDDIKTPEAFDPGVLPNFNYRAVSLSVQMQGTYHDCGAFLADLENSYPYMRVQLVSITPQIKSSPMGERGQPRPTVTASTDEPGKLQFNYRVIALIKSLI